MVHGLLSLHTAPAPAHLPDLQTSLVVHTLPSSHGVPSATAANAQLPVALSQLSLVQMLLSAQVLVMPEHFPAVQTSGDVHPLPSLQAELSAALANTHWPLAMAALVGAGADIAVAAAGAGGQGGAGASDGHVAYIARTGILVVAVDGRVGRVDALLPFAGWRRAGDRWRWAGRVCARREESAVDRVKVTAQHRDRVGAGGSGLAWVAKRWGFAEGCSGWTALGGIIPRRFLALTLLRERENIATTPPELAAWGYKCWSNS